jgi:hypothetical protein
VNWFSGRLDVWFKGETYCHTAPDAVFHEVSTTEATGALVQLKTEHPSAYALYHPASCAWHI